MKKRFIFLAAAASACTCSTALAQVSVTPSVTPYGTIDNAMEYQNGGAGALTRAVSSGLFATVYGFRGSENLGRGLRVNFQLEQGFDATTGTAADTSAAFNRLAWVGLSGPYGELRLGRQKKPEYLFLNNETDPTGVKSIASPMNNFGDDSVRSSNAIAYFAPTIGGFTEQFMVALREETDQPTLLSYNAVMRYTNGQFRAAAGYERSGKSGSTVEQKVLRTVLSHGVGNARLYLAYQKEERTDHSEKLQIYEVSGSYRFDPVNQLSLLYGYARDRSGKDNDAQQLGLLYEYTLSRRTLLYSSAGLIQNRNGAQYTLDGTQYSGIPGAPGAYVRGMNVGITHKF
jgi:predicted porin